MLFLLKVMVPAGDLLAGSPIELHSMNGTASFMLYPLVHVTVIYQKITKTSLFLAKRYQIKLLPISNLYLAPRGKKKLTSSQLFPKARRG